MQFHLSHRLWFALARLPFRRNRAPLPDLPLFPIFGQTSLSHVPAGRRTMDYMGCEMIALYNALLFTGRPRPLGQIIEMFEDRRWLLLGGRWGADPYAIGRYLREEGIPFLEYSGKRRFSVFAQAMCIPENRVLVLSYWLGDTVFSGAHAVTLVRWEGELWAYDLFDRQTEPLPVADLFRQLPPARFIVGYVLGGAAHDA